jgi:hypothetical protein
MVAESAQALEGQMSPQAHLSFCSCVTLGGTIRGEMGTVPPTTQDMRH